jgi:UDP-N-acetylglucosamine--N-acetylmuramyl-(pentapeptide) pyrophosphoryl-undecaprenol N-acetylglucosamine transferase
MAGGTGGHIFPGLAVAAELSARAVPIVWLGAQGGLETRLVPARGIALETIRIRGVRGKGVLALFAMPLRLGVAVFRACRMLRRLRPRAVLSMGGYVAAPGGLAAWLTRIPLVVHEQNRIPGSTNRLLARFARRVLAGFADALPNAEWVGNPVRREIAQLEPPQVRLGARRGRVRLLVLGGSQGAHALNLHVPAALALLPPAARPEVRHQCGARHAEAAGAAYDRADVAATVEPFIEDMAAAYGWADLVIARAGALTLAELAAAGLGAVLVPYPHAIDDHQRANAEVLVAAGAAAMLVEDQLDPARLAAILEPLLDDPGLRLGMARAARALARPDAAVRIAETCLEVAR